MIEVNTDYNRSFTNISKAAMFFPQLMLRVCIHIEGMLWIVGTEYTAYNRLVPRDGQY